MEDVVSVDLASVYRGRRVLLTGHTGFKGSWLALWLKHLGAEVTGYALAPEYENSHFAQLDLGTQIKHVIADVRDSEALASTVSDAQPEFIFHLAAQALVRRAYDDPKTTFDTNVGGTVNLLEATRAADTVRALVFVTSDKAYRNKEWTWGYRENDELGGQEPYGASKAAAELVFTAYHESFFRQRPDLGVVTTRAGNVIGGGDWALDRIIPDCIRALQAEEPVVLRNPSATRPWQHVLDTLYGYLHLGAALANDPARFSGAWNFGPEIDAGLTVRQLAEGAVEQWGAGEVAAAEEDLGPFEHKLLQLNIDKARLKLGWRPIWSSEQAIDKSIWWYRQVFAGVDVRQTSLSQIIEFMAATSD